MKKICIIYGISFSVAIALMILAWLSHNDKYISISVMSFFSLLAGLAGSIMGEKKRNKQPIPAKVLKRMIILFVCSIAVILIGYYTDYLIVGCAVSFILGCIALFDVIRTLKN
ncbi:MAG: hypothetical protein IJ534_01695 [Bacteroidaceae bacterium]|nr:hypothetical protein [Bacteroidaceae bacterium]